MNQKNEEFKYLGNDDNLKQITAELNEINSLCENIGNYFNDINNPTENELTLFELSYGEDMYHMVLNFYNMPKDFVKDFEDIAV